MNLKKNLFFRFFWIFWIFLIRFWLVKTYQYGWHSSVLSHHVLGTAECHESYCNKGWGNHIWSFFRRGVRIFFTISHTATRALPWPYMDFWTYKFCGRSVPGWGYTPIWELGVSMALYEDATTPRVFGVHTKSHSLLLLSPIRRGFAPGFVNYKKGALDSQPQVIKFTRCLFMVGGSLRILRLLPPLKIAMIKPKYCWKGR